MILFGGLFVLLLTLTLLLSTRSDAKTAEIYSGGKLLRTVELSQEQQFTVEYQGGYNTITVRDGKICVTEASCKNHQCIAYGAKSGGAPIICLPNRLLIRFCDRNAPDAIVG